MTRRRSMLDWTAQRVMDLDSPAYGDERDRAVFMESSSFGLTVGIYLGLLGAVVALVFGLVSVVLLSMAILPSSAALWYARWRDVDLQAFAENAGARSTMVNSVLFGAVMVLTFAAMTYTVLMGQPVLPGPSLEVSAGEGFLGGMVQGAAVGGMLGGLAAIVGGLRSFRRANRRRQTREH